MNRFAAAAKAFPRTGEGGMTQSGMTDEGADNSCERPKRELLNRRNRPGRYPERAFPER